MFQKTLYRIGLLCFMVMLMVVAVACKEDNNPLVGKWENPEDRSQSFEFFQNGTVAIGNEGITVTANYEIVDDTHLRFDIQGDLLTLEFKISGDTLTLSDGRMPMHFKRVKK